jgi:hypothetical protein
MFDIYDRSSIKRAIGLSMALVIIIGTFGTLVTSVSSHAQESPYDPLYGETAFPKASILETSCDDAGSGQDPHDYFTSYEEEISVEKAVLGTCLSPPTVTSGGGNSLTVTGVAPDAGWARVTLYRYDPFNAPFHMDFIDYCEAGRDGSFYLTVPWDWEWGSSIDIFLFISARSSAVKVRDNPAWVPDILPGNDGVIYSFRTDYVHDVQDHDSVNMHTVSVPNEIRGAFNIVKTITEGRNFLNARTGAWPGHVNAFWGDWFTPGRSYCYPESLPTKGWGWLVAIVDAISFGSGTAGLEANVGIHIDDDNPDDAWNEDVILHEYGHWLMDKYGGFWPPNSKLDHSFGVASDQATAWVEGWAHFFSAAAREYAGMADFKDNPPIESPNLVGSNVEGAVAGALWDLYDGYDSNEPEDSGLPIAFSRIFHVMGEPVQTVDLPLGMHIHVYISSIYEFRGKFIAHYPELRTPLWHAFNLHGLAEPDSGPPKNPTLYEFSHTVGEQSWGARIRVKFQPGEDDLSGVWGYRYFWDNEPETRLPKIGGGDSYLLASERRVIISPTLSAGEDWYFHLRTADYAGNLADQTYHAGPFQVKIEDPDDDTTGPTLSNPASYFYERDWAIVGGHIVRGTFLFLTLGIEAEDVSGISSVDFDCHYGYSGEEEPTFWSSGNSYYAGIQISAPWNYHEKPLQGQVIEWEVQAFDNDDEGWEDKASTLSKFNTTLQEAPHDYSPLTLPFLNVTIANWPLDVLITAPNGLRMGHDSRTGLDVSEIYPAFIFGSMPEQFLIPAPIEGNYIIETLGMEAGPYSIIMEYVDANGTILNSVSFAGTIEPGKLKTQRMEFDPDGAIGDSSPPILSAIITGSLGLNDWYVSDVNVTITAVDDMSGVAMTEFSIDGENWTMYTGPFTISVEGARTLNYQSMDNNENRESAFSEINIDKSQPATGRPDPPLGYAIEGEVTFKINVTDNISGTSSVNLTIYDEIGNLVGTEDMPASFDPAMGLWNLTLNVPQLVNGYYEVVVEIMDEAGNLGSMTFLYGSMSLSPSCLILKSSKPYLNATIELPEGYAVENIDTATILLNDTFELVPAAPVTIGDLDNDTITDLTVSFNRTAISQYILSLGITKGNITLSVTGQLTDGAKFEGSSLVRVRMPGDMNGDSLVELSDFFLAAEAFGSYSGHPRWNPVADENEDGIVEMMDFIIMSIHYGEHW